MAQQPLGRIGHATLGPGDPLHGTPTNDLLVRVLAAEMYLTHFASRHEQTSQEYQSSLKDFANAWYQLRLTRGQHAFHREVKVS